MKQTCIVWGAGHYGHALMETLNGEDEYEILAYCDRDRQLVGKKVGGYDIISVEAAIERCLVDENLAIIIGIFDYRIIEEIQKDIKARFPKHTRVVVGHSIQDRAENEMLRACARNRTFQWHVDVEKYFLEWMDNLMSEVEYWVKEVANVRGRRHVYNRNCRRNHMFTHPAIAQRIRGGETVLDIGCGLVSRFGDRLEDGRTVRLIPVDALAHFYNIMNGHIRDGLKENYSCRFGLFEFMGNIFECGFADYIIIDNALDHCIDPWKSLVECLYVLKDGGYMYLNHRRAEAVYEGWTGLHKWNIDCHKGDFIIWNKENAKNVTEELKNYADIKVTFDETVLDRERQNIGVSIRKKRDFSMADFFDIDKESVVLMQCMDKMMERWAADSKEFFSMLEQVEM